MITLGETMIFINTQLALHLTQPNYKSAQHIEDYANSTDNPTETLSIITGCLLAELAKLLHYATDGPEAAMNYLLDGIQLGKNEANE